MIEQTYADGHPERLAGLAAVLARVPYDLVVASGSDAVDAARAAIQSIPTVGISSSMGVGRQFGTVGGQPERDRIAISTKSPTNGWSCWSKRFRACNALAYYSIHPLPTRGCSRLSARRQRNSARHCGRCGSITWRCGNPAVYDLPSRKWHWQCEKCTRDGYRFSILVGTIFENTNKPLRDWFRVAHLMLTSKKGMSALQIMRYMGFGSYKTAWEMCHKIRVALMEDIEKLGGIVEVDETEVGGKDRSRHWDKRDHRRGRGSPKATVVGAVKRKGNVIARVVENVKAPRPPQAIRPRAARQPRCLRYPCAVYAKRQKTEDQPGARSDGGL